ncbi:MAG TPA: hypothetical protein DCP97_03760 [Ruminococcaceae bacterium]|nr:hypothetical protein [Oscillospiraceae bacterium]
MYELFDAGGHLTDYALKALSHSQHELTDLQRLEISEHLSFCDDCLIRYTELLSDDVLIAPPEPIAQTVMQRIKKRARAVFLNRYVSVAVAAGFAVVFWTTGVFSPGKGLSQPYINAADSVAKSTASIAQRAVNATHGFSDGINSMIDNLFQKGDITNEKE